MTHYEALQVKKLKHAKNIKPSTFKISIPKNEKSLKMYSVNITYMFELLHMSFCWCMTNLKHRCIIHTLYVNTYICDGPGVMKNKYFVGINILAIKPADKKNRSTITIWRAHIISITARNRVGRVWYMQ